MRTLWKWILGICLVVVVIQLIRPERANPSVNTARTIHARMPLDSTVSATLARSCNDCHSNLTAWPWYSNFAPVSWIVISDVRRGRRELNFSEWEAYPVEKQQELLKEICKEVSDKEMPGSIYVLMHPSAKLSDIDVHSICTWTQSPNQTQRQDAAKE